MWMMPEQDLGENDDSTMSLDWESLGRLVRRGTCDAVAAHFAALAERQEKAPTPEQVADEGGAS